MAAAIPGLLVLVPIGFVLFQGFSVTPTRAATLLFRPLVGELLFNTISLLAVVTVLCALVATAAAWFIERTDLPGRSVWSVLVVVPLAVPPFATSYAWVSISPALQDFAGAVLVITTSHYPLIYLPVSAALKNMNPSLEETARALGVGPVGAFFRVVLPQLRPALFGGMLLVALSTLVEFGAFSLLRFRTFTTEIFAEYKIGFGGPEASFLAIVLVALCVICLIGELAVRPGTHETGSGGLRRAPRPLPLGARRWPALFAMALLLLIALGVPVGAVIFWLLQHASAATSPSGASAAGLAGATFSSLGLGLAGAAFTLVLALPLGYLTARYQGPLVTVLERVAYLSQGVPGIVIALAFISISVQYLHALYQSYALLILAYALIFLPLALVSVRTALIQAPPRLEEASRVLGVGWTGTLTRVLLPLISPGLGAAAAMVFVSVVTELTTTLLLAPIGTRTLATQIWSNTSSVAYAAAAPYTAIMMVLSVGSTWFLARRFGATRLPLV